MLRKMPRIFLSYKYIENAFSVFGYLCLEKCPAFFSRQEPPNKFGGMNT